MAGRYIVIEIGTKTVKMTQYENHQFMKTIIETLPAHCTRGGRMNAGELLAVFLKDTARKHRLKGRSVVFVLSDSETYTRKITIPYMTDEQVRLNLPYEFHDFIPERKDRFIFDYKVITITKDALGKPISMTIMADAVSKHIVEDYQQLTRRAGWKLKGAVSASAFYSALFREHDSRAEGKAAKEYCLVDLGYHSSKVWFFKEGCLEAKREIEEGLENVIRAVEMSRHVDVHVAEIYVKENYQRVCEEKACQDVYERISVEVHNTVEFYRYRYPESRFNTIYICGGGAHIETFRETLAEWTGMQAKDIGGLEMNALSFDRLPNLAMPEKDYKKARRMIPAVLAGMILLGLFVKVGVLEPLEEVKRSGYALEQTIAKVKEYQDYNADYDVIENEFNTHFSTYLSEEEISLQKRQTMLSLIETQVMNQADVMNITIEGQVCQIVITGTSLSGIAEVAENLKLCPEVEYVEISNVVSDKVGENLTDRQSVIADVTITFSGGEADGR